MHVRRWLLVLAAGLGVMFVATLLLVAARAYAPPEEGYRPASAFPPRSPRPRPPRPRPTPTPVVPENPAEWSQHAHDAQHTGYTSQVVPYP